MVKEKTRRNFHVLLDRTTTLKSPCINKYFNLSRNVVNADDHLLRLTSINVVHYVKYNSVAV